MVENVDRSGEIRRVLITGAAGSSGRMLADYLRREHPGVQVFGACRRKNSRRPLAGVRMFEVDLLDSNSILHALHEAAPDAIFHAAANPDKCFETPSAVLQHNAVGTANLLESVRVWGRWGDTHKPPVVVVVSSSEVYGDVLPEELPVKETNPTRPVSPYAVSKLACDHLGRIYFKAYGLRTVITRAFTYLNPLRPDLFASSFARQIAEIEAGKSNILRHGNLDSVRVVCDARDIMEAYWLAATRCRFGEAYNIAGGTKTTVREVLWGLLQFSTARVKMEQDPALMRPVDVTLQVADTTKFRTETGWAPKFDLDSSLKALLDHYRREVVRE